MRTNVINMLLRNINLANMFDRYDNERTLWNLRYNICLQRFVIWNCDNLQLLVSLVAIKQLLIIIDNLFDPYCNNYSPQREKHDSTNIITHIIWLIWVRTSDSEGMSHHLLSTQESVLILIASYLNVKISFFILSIFSYKKWTSEKRSLRDIFLFRILAFWVDA